MFSQSLPPFKYSKLSPSDESSLAKPTPLNKIPRRLCSTIVPFRARRRYDVMIGLKDKRWIAGSKEVWDYLCRVKKVYRCDLFNHLEINMGGDLYELYGSRREPPKLDSLRRFPAIKKLSISFNFHSDITDEYVESLMIDICHTLQLEELVFSITPCEQISVETLKASIIQIARHQLDLKALYIMPQIHPRIDNEGLEIIGYEVGRHSVNLRSFGISFNQSKSGSSSTPTPKLEGSNAIKQKTTKFSDKGLKALGCYLGRFLINLNHLAIRMDCITEVGNNGLKGLVSGLSKDLGHLKYLVLSFRECASLTGSGMKSTANEICKHFKSLHFLDFSLNRCENVFPNDVKAVKNKIEKEMSFLKSLRINDMQIFDLMNPSN